MPCLLSLEEEERRSQFSLKESRQNWKKCSAFRGERKKAQQKRERKEEKISTRTFAFSWFLAMVNNGAFDYSLSQSAAQAWLSVWYLCVFIQFCVHVSEEKSAQKSWKITRIINKAFVCAFLCSRLGFISTRETTPRVVVKSARICTRSIIIIIQ